MRKLQLYVTEEQYRLLKRRADDVGSIAGVVRELIDRSTALPDPESDPFYEHVLADRPGSARRYGAERAKRDLYRTKR